MADWSNLPDDVIRSIAKRICDPKDFVGFGAVCKPWSLVMTKEHFTHQLPWVMISHPNLRLSDPFRFHSLTNDKIYKIDLPEAVMLGEWFFFSAMGWLITITEGMEVNLVYLFRPTAEVIKLGNIKIPQDFIAKFVLSSSPYSTSSYRIMALTKTGSVLVFCGNEWVSIDGGYADVAYYQGQFYGVNEYNGLVAVFNTEDPKHITTNVTSSMPKGFLSCGNKLYLVKSGEDLLVAVRRFSSKKMFRTYKVSFFNHNWLDSEVKDLGNKTLSLSSKQSSLSVNTSNCYSRQASYIYYADFPKSLFIFNLIDGNAEPFRYNKAPRAAEKQGGRSSPKKTKLGHEVSLAQTKKHAAQLAADTVTSLKIFPVKNTKVTALKTSPMKAGRGRGRKERKRLKY